MCSSQPTIFSPPPCLSPVLKSSFASSSPFHVSFSCQSTISSSQAAGPIHAQTQPCELAFTSECTLQLAVSACRVRDSNGSVLGRPKLDMNTAVSTRSRRPREWKLVTRSASKSFGGNMQTHKSVGKETKVWKERNKKSDESTESGFRQQQRHDNYSDELTSPTEDEDVFRGEQNFANGDVTESLKEEGRPKYGDRWINTRRDASMEANTGKKKKPPKIREQVRLLSPLNKNPQIAIVGGGMSGLICALTLEERGIRSTVFDSGKHGLGGRMGTRHIAQANGLPLVFDHAAQYFTVTDNNFQSLVNQWIAGGAVKEWDGVIGALDKDGKFSQSPPCTKYIATNGMRPLADYIVSKRKLLDTIRPCWISSMDEVNGMWHLTENGKFRGAFDVVIIAHNGKCANRLLGPVGVPHIAKQMKRLDLSSIWALLAAFEEPLPLCRGVQVDGAFVAGIDSLSWIGNNTAKLQLEQDHGPYCWTFFSTAAYGKKHKVPQESIPTAKALRVKREMLQGVERAFGLAEGSLPTPIYTKVQLWGAALPTNTPNLPCIFDAYGRVGICGDWLLGSSLEAAAVSGMATAEHIAKFCTAEGSNPEDFNIGLDKEFSKINGHDIGQFPGQESVHKLLIPELLTAV